MYKSYCENCNYDTNDYSGTLGTYVKIVHPDDFGNSTSDKPSARITACKQCGYVKSFFVNAVIDKKIFPFKEDEKTDE
ncbi:hypothetical protein SFC65_20045 [Priestia filamentosa]|uniref:hypothetical protein n=1 Tax=Priestia filamentosa TaxID=1402861 RepID=UPI0039826C38